MPEQPVTFCWGQERSFFSIWPLSSRLRNRPLGFSRGSCINKSNKKIGELQRTLAEVQVERIGGMGLFRLVRLLVSQRGHPLN